MCSVFIPVGTIPEVHKNLLFSGVTATDLFTGTLPGNDLWDFIVVDYRKTPASLIDLLQPRGFLIGIDEGGTSRGSFTFLIDVIPSPVNPVKPNLSATGLMDLPEKRLYDDPPYNYRKIIITFGGEDPENLTASLLDVFKIYGYFQKSEITVVTAKKNIKDLNNEDIKFLVNPANLKDILHEYDLVFTSFGLTAFESLAAGVPFILLDPSPYHHKLSLNCGFHEIGILKPDRKKMDKFIRDKAEFMVLQEKYIPDKYTDLKDIVLSINKTKNDCPVCHHECRASDITHRFETRNFYRCPVCSISFQVSFLLSYNNYKKEYFFEDYKKQYGKTYLEDFESIQKMAVRRIKIIQSIQHLPANNVAALLDVGCAYGPFLAEASKHGYIPTGVEIIQEAVGYVRSELGFQVLSGSFEELSFKKNFDILTMWYVIEHFSDLYLVLAKVNSLLRPGGIFAFSTPNSAGITGKKSMERFLKKSPVDHISIWNPETADKILRRFGFEIKRVRVTGHHAERFPGFSKLKSKSGYKIMNFISRILKLGDTFEIYAQKMKECDG